MRSPSYCLIVNKASNSGRASYVLKKYINYINSLLIKNEIYEVDIGESISEIAREKSKTFDVIVACGGDGTVQKVAIGLLESNVIFGVLPLGSGNDFAKMLGFSKSITDNLIHLSKLKTKKIDVVKSNSDYFINTFGIGFDGMTNNLASKSHIKGRLKYLISGVEALFYTQIFSILIQHENKTSSYSTMMTIIANGKWEGGKYLVSPTSENHDGKFEIIILKDITRFRLALEFVKLSLGHRLSNNLFSFIKTNKVLIKLNKLVLMHSDGEIQKPEQNFKIEILEHKLETIISSF